MLLCMLASMAIYAQTVITGTVVDASDGEPLPGAAVKVKGAQQGVLTDANGKFKMNVEAGTQLIFSFMGMETVAHPAKNGMHVAMRHFEEVLDEVMVVAYGTQKKSSFTGSAAVLKSDDIARVSDSNPLDALKGKMAGVQINNASGAPGQNTFSMRVRGISSINAGKAPLIIVDGAPFDGEFNALNPNDIATMTVLKDAASAALYGARGANGVLLITTKAGQGDQHVTSIEVETKWGSNSRSTPEYNLISSPKGYYEMWHTALRNKAMYRDGLSQQAAYQWANANLINGDYGLRYNVYNVPAGQAMIGTNGKMNPNATLGNLVMGKDGQMHMLLPDDWSKEGLRNGLRQEYNVTVRGRSDRSSFFASAGWMRNEGLVHNSDFTRFSTRMKADYQLKPWIKVAGNFNYAHYENNQLGDDGESSTASGMFNLIRFSAPIYPLYLRDANGKIMRDDITGGKAYDYGNADVLPMARPYLGDGNAIGDSYLNTINVEGNTFSAVGSADIRFLKDFTFSSINNVSVDESRGTDLANPWFGQMANYGGYVYKSHGRTFSQNYQQLLKWQHLFDRHDVEVMIGHEYYNRKTYALSASRNGLFSNENTELAGAITDASMNSYKTEYNVEGYFGRALYNFDTKYFLSASYRRDASSRFHPDHRWGNFWSAGAAWIINKEKWFNADWVDELKVKASYGSQGNDDIGDYLYTPRYTIENSDGKISLVPSSTKANEYVTWEKQGNFNAGFELSLWKSRLTAEIEYFNRTTRDMLAWFTLPPTSGFKGYYDNVGNMSNQGVEITLGGDLIRTKNFTWGLNMNLTWYKNRITYMPEENKTMTVDGVRGYSSSNMYYGEGQPMYTFYMLKYAGVDPETGAAQYWKNITDSDSGKIIGREKTTKTSEADQYLCGTALPSAYGGFSTNLAYKGFDLSIDFQYQIGGQVNDGTYATLMGNSKGSAMHADLLNAWTPNNTTTDIPRYEADNTNMAASSDRWLTDASYLSIQGLNFGYTLPSKLTHKMHISKLRVYMNAGNLWLFSARRGMDPRQSITGSVNGAYHSQMRTITGGVSITL